MPYCTLTDIERALQAGLPLRLLDDDNDGNPDADVVAQVLEDGTHEINGYVGRLYDVAMLEADPPPMLRRLATDVCVQLCYLRRPEFFNDKSETPWEGRYRRALKMLDEIRKGEFRLDVDSKPAPAANVKGAGLYTSEGKADSESRGFIFGGSGTF